MSEISHQSAVRPALSRMERKADATDRAFRAIIDGENTVRDRKTARLKALRMKKEAAEALAKSETSPRERK